MFNCGKFNRMAFNRSSLFKLLKELEYVNRFTVEVSASILEKPRLMLSSKSFDNSFRFLTAGGLVLTGTSFEMQERFEVITLAGRIAEHKSELFINNFEIIARASIIALGRAEQFLSAFVLDTAPGLLVPLRPKREYQAFFVVLVNPTKLQYETAIINTAMTPGQTLIIDTEAYTVTLNGINIMEQYQGDWFKLVPDSDWILANFSGRSDIAVKIEYIERWL